MKKFGTLMALLVVTAHAQAAQFGVRGAMGAVQTAEDFEAYELFIVLDLPWSRSRGGSTIQTQFGITGGVLDAAGQSGFLGTLGPRIAVHTDAAIFDAGVGVAALSETDYGNVDFGGSPQFVAHVGMAFPLTTRLSFGVRYRHISDGGIHSGDDVNLVLTELAYDFGE